MKFWVGNTDSDWFSFLSRERPEEINFWQPGGRAPFVGRPVGMPFFFRLKSPVNAIVGGAYFTTFSRVSTRMAWDVFGIGNGCGDFPTLLAKINAYNRQKGITPDVRGDREIGCSVLINPFFLEPSRWVRDIPAWEGPIVVGKTYDTDTPDGRLLWDRVVSAMAVNDVFQQPAIGDIADRAPGQPSAPAPGLIIDGPPNAPKFGAPTLVAPRLGQGAFRVMVTDAYDRKCAITGESTLIALEAAHIRPYSDIGGHEVKNGMLLRADFHKLFDAGLVGVTPDYNIHVSPLIREQYYNGKAYYRLDNQRLSVLPRDPLLRPDRDHLEWHYDNVFQRGG